MNESKKDFDACSTFIKGSFDPFGRLASILLTEEEIDEKILRLSNTNKQNNELRKLAELDFNNKKYTDAMEKIKTVFQTNGTIIEWDYWLMGNCLIETNELQNGLDYLINGLKRFKTKTSLDNLVGVCNGYGWRMLFKNEYSNAINFLTTGLKYDSKNLFLTGNLAHAYLLSGEYKIAKDIYIANKGKWLNDKLSWEKMVNDDFTEFQKAGIQNKKFEKILDLMKN